tara:strand:- start:1558 stop:2403 length:846 start_codon:yes stop_codon:yes gene_type:complete
MKIAIIGYGFVGKALESSLTEDVSVLKIDPKLGSQITEINDFHPDIIFICVPTPMNSEFSQDLSILHKVVNELNAFNTKSIVVLKSTVLPNHLREINNQIQNLIYNPEFLREKSAEADFINSNLIVFGGNIENAKKISAFYLNYTNCICKEHIFTDLISASFVKYSINTFLATKISFFNELYTLYCSAVPDGNWEEFIKILLRDNRMGNSHMNVPGHDGRFGFGGACLPKDSNAFLNYAKDLNIDLNVLQNAILTNNKIRGKYNKPTLRETEQNINFNGED